MLASKLGSSSGTLVRREGLRLGLCPVRRPLTVVHYAFVEEKRSGGDGERLPQAGVSVVPAHQLTSIDFKDLAGGRDLTADIEKALGPAGLGAVIIRNVPTYSRLRRKLLPLAERFASLPEEVKEKYVDADSRYNFGWSHGKESLASGVLDTLKGSFYANPLVDDPLQPTNSDWLQPWEFPPTTEEPAGGKMPSSLSPAGGTHVTVATGTAGKNLSEDEVSQLRRTYPGYFHRNLWPREELPELEAAFKDLGRLICAVGCLLAEHCDRYISTRLGAQSGQVSGVLRRSLNPKARLLHYFAPSRSAANGGDVATQQQQPASASSQAEADADDEHAWCGLHTDHGSLTGLTAAMYLDEQGREVPSPDPDAGLYIRDRNGRFTRAVIPPECIAFQVGEALQVHSGGLLMATPHYVRAPRSHLAGGISRNTFAVFMQPDVGEPMDCPPGVDPTCIAVGQWKPGHTFGEFAEATFTQYYSRPPQ